MGKSTRRTVVSRRRGFAFYEQWCRENAVQDLDPDLVWLEEAWCLVRDRGLLAEKNPRSPEVRARWSRLRAVLGALGG